MGVKEKKNDKDLTKERQEEGRSAAFHFSIPPHNDQIKKPTHLK